MSDYWHYTTQTEYRWFERDRPAKGIRCRAVFCTEYVCLRYHTLLKPLQYQVKYRWQYHHDISIEICQSNKWVSVNRFLLPAYLLRTSLYSVPLLSTAFYYLFPQPVSSTAARTRAHGGQSDVKTELGRPRGSVSGRSCVLHLNTASGMPRLTFVLSFRKRNRLRPEWLFQQLPWRQDIWKQNASRYPRILIDRYQSEYYRSHGAVHHANLLNIPFFYLVVSSSIYSESRGKQI